MLEHIFLALWSNYSVDTALSDGTLHLLATITTFTHQLVKHPSWQNSKTQSSCQLKNTAYWIVLSWWIFYNTQCYLGSASSVLVKMRQSSLKNKDTETWILFLHQIVIPAPIWNILGLLLLDNLGPILQ